MAHFGWIFCFSHRVFCKIGYCQFGKIVQIISMPFLLPKSGTETPVRICQWQNSPKPLLAFSSGAEVNPDQSLLRLSCDDFCLISSFGFLLWSFRLFHNAESDWLIVNHNDEHYHRHCHDYHHCHCHHRLNHCHHHHNYRHHDPHHLVKEECKMCSLNGMSKISVVHHNQWRFPTKLKGHSLRKSQIVENRSDIKDFFKTIIEGCWHQWHWRMRMILVTFRFEAPAAFWMICPTSVEPVNATWCNGPLWNHLVTISSCSHISIQPFRDPPIHISRSLYFWS